MQITQVKNKSKSGTNIIFRGVSNFVEMSQQNGEDISNFRDDFN